MFEGTVIDHTERDMFWLSSVLIKCSHACMNVRHLEADNWLLKIYIYFIGIDWLFSEMHTRFQ